MFKVMRKRCDQCLFSENKIVSNARKREILTTCATKDSHFICHKTKDACCRGFYDIDPGRTNLMRIAGRLGAVEFVDPPAKIPVRRVKIVVRRRRHDGHQA